MKQSSGAVHRLLAGSANSVMTVQTIEYKCLLTGMRTHGCMHDIWHGFSPLARAV